MRKAQVIWSAGALVDLEVIYDFLVEKSQPAAQRIVENILARTKQLETFPESGSIQEHVKNNGKEYRYLVEGSNKIIYSYLPESLTIYIETIFDTRNDPDKINV